MAAFFDTRYKMFAHIAQLVLTIIVIALAGYRMANQTPGVPSSTGDRMSLAVGAKSLIVLAYQLLTDHVARFERWASLKANLILNCLEILFWAVVGGLGIQGNMRFCGTTCTVGWLLSVLNLVLCIMSIYVSIISYKEFRAYKRGGHVGHQRVTSSVPLRKGNSSYNSHNVGV